MCPGYRDQLTLMFRDQSDQVVSKFQDHNHRRKSCVSTSDSQASKTVGQGRLVRPLARCNIPVSVSFDPEGQASTFFFYNYVLDESPSNPGYMKFLPGMYNSSAAGSALSQMVISLGMAGLANATKSPEIMIAAVARYNSALRLVSTAIQSLEEAKKDETLTIVILLGLFEVRLTPSRRSPINMVRP